MPSVAPADYNILSKFKSLADYRRANEEFEAKKQLQEIQALAFQAKIAGLLQPKTEEQNLPASLQLANEYAKARQDGNKQRMEDIAAFSKIYDKGVSSDVSGVFGQFPGYAGAIAGIAGAKAGAEQAGKKQVDLNYNPKIVAAENAEKLVSEPPIKQANAAAEQVGESAGKNEASKEKKIAQAPVTIQLIYQAKDLLPKSTSGGLNKLKRDTAAYFDVATEESKVDRKLEIISSQLLQNVPRFEGPQSNFDIEEYKRAVGDLANASLPRETRIAAADKMLELQNKVLGISPADAIKEELKRRGKL